ncbi:MAG: hypothetical protein FJ088_06190 [Deltaproteobacteria bacterium]|nr:hypothetical protein [Deltaproteobacteria bacterium]
MGNIFSTWIKTCAFLATALALQHCSSQNVNILSKEREASFAEKAKKFKDQTCFDARYNPPACDCPQFEIKLGGEWARAEIEPSSKALDAFNTLLSNAESDIREKKNAVYKLSGKLSFSKKRCASNALCFDFDFEGFCEGL